MDTSSWPAWAQMTWGETLKGCQPNRDKLKTSIMVAKVVVGSLVSYDLRPPDQALIAPDIPEYCVGLVEQELRFGIIYRWFAPGLEEGTHLWFADLVVSLKGQVTLFIGDGEIETTSFIVSAGIEEALKMTGDLKTVLQFVRHRVMMFAPDIERLLIKCAGVKRALCPEHPTFEKRPWLRRLHSELMQAVETPHVFHGSLMEQYPAERATLKSKTVLDFLYLYDVDVIAKTQSISVPTAIRALTVGGIRFLWEVTTARIPMFGKDYATVSPEGVKNEMLHYCIPAVARYGFIHCHNDGNTIAGVGAYGQETRWMPEVKHSKLPYKGAVGNSIVNIHEFLLSNDSVKSVGEPNV